MSRSFQLRSLTLRALLPLGLFFAGASAPQAATLASSPVVGPQEGFAAIMGEELVVDGARYRSPEILRAVVTGRLGSAPLQNLKLRLLIAQEVARRIEAGAQPEDFLVTDEELKGAVEDQKKFLKEEFPEGAYTVENVMEGGLNAFKSQVELTRLFNRTFLPAGDPNDYPAITLAALAESEVGTAVLKQLREDWEVDKLRVTPESKNPLLKTILFQEIFDYLERTSVFQEGSEVPADVIVRINGDDITVEDVWNEIKDQATVNDVLEAKKWLVNMHLLRKGLADVWLSDEEAAASFEEHAAPFDASMIPMKNFALGVLRYPSMEAYRQFRHAHDSFKKRIQADITPENLREFAELRTRKLVGGSTVDVDVILLSAYDFQNKKWKADGWAKAEARAREVITKLQQKQDWDDLLDEYSEFYDAPGEATSVNLKYKGRFRNVGRNDLMQKLGEDDYQAFINGGTLADFIFFKSEAGAVGGVKKGPHGWYIPLVRKRTDKPIRNDQAQLITMAEQDYVAVHLGIFLADLYRGAQIQGLLK